MKLSELRGKFRKLTSDIRSALRVVESDDFADAMGTADIDINLVATFGSAAAVRKWIGDMTQKPLTAWGYKKLRDTAANNHVVNYSRMTRDQLIEALIAKGVTGAGQSEANPRDGQSVGGLPADVGCP